jgi:hypothetical protein
LFNIKCYVRLTLWARIANPRYPLGGHIRAIWVILSQHTPSGRGSWGSGGILKISIAYTIAELFFIFLT